MQRDSPFTEIGDGAGDRGDGSAEPVDRGNDHAVSGPGIVEQRDQSRPCAHPYRRTTTTMKRSDHQTRNTLSENVIHVGTCFVAKERPNVVEASSTLGPHFVTRDLFPERISRGVG
jgi:hypothetical protein